MADLNTFRVSLVGQDGFQSTVVVTFHYVPTINNIDPSASDCADCFANAIDEGVADITVSGVNYNKIVVRDEGDPLVGVELAHEVNGVVAGAAMPPQIAGQIEKLTGFIGRRNRGRTYWPGASENQNDAGAPNETYRDSLEIVMNQLLVLNDALTNLVPRYKMVVFSKVGDSSRDVVGFRASEEWGTQGRRKPGRGA